MKKDELLNNVKYKQVDIFDDIVEIPEWLFREK